MNKPPRERRESKYGTKEGERAVGGEARRRVHKGHMSKVKAEKAVGGVSFDPKKRRKLVIKHKSAAEYLPSTRPGDPHGTRPIPEAGANSAALDARAEAEGITPQTQRPTSPFQKLKEMGGVPTKDTGGQDENGADFMPDAFAGNRVVLRELPTPEAEAHQFETYRNRLPILRNAPIAVIDASEEEPKSEKPGKPKEKTELETIPKHAQFTRYSTDQEKGVAKLMGMPGVICNNCPATEQCSEYKPNSACAFDEDFRQLPTRDVNNLLPRLEVIAEFQMERAMRGVFLEKRVGGGQLDPNVSRQLEIAAAAAERVAKLKAPVQQQTQHMTVVAQNAQINQGEGILSKLMMSVMPQPAAPVLPVIDTTATELVLNDAPMRGEAMPIQNGEGIVSEPLKP